MSRHPVFRGLITNVVNWRRNYTVHMREYITTLREDVRVSLRATKQRAQVLFRVLSFVNGIAVIYKARMRVFTVTPVAAHKGTERGWLARGGFMRCLHYSRKAANTAFRQQLRAAPRDCSTAPRCLKVKLLFVR